MSTDVTRHRPRASTIGMTWAHGPDRTAMWVSRAGVATSLCGRPFHGIASRGVCSWLDQRPDGAALWERYACLLDYESSGADACELRELRAVAASHQVLSFGQSAMAARMYIEGWQRDANDDIISCELWNIKEGHTSSVWIATLHGRATVRQSVLNVARDAEGGDDLSATAQRMRALAATRPDLPMASVLDVATVVVRSSAAKISVAVTRNEFIADALEVRRWPSRPDAPGQYALVERFLTDPDRPARITGFRGRIATEDEERLIAEAVARFVDVSVSDVPIRINVNEGDIVWDGRGVVVVAVS